MAKIVEYENPVLKRNYKIGDFFKLREDGEILVLCQVSNKEVQLFITTNFNRWDDAIEVSNVLSVTPKEIYKLASTNSWDYWAGGDDVFISREPLDKQS